MYINEQITNGVAFTFRILEFFSSKKEAFDYEDKLILETNAVFDENFYNLSRGGKEFNYASRTHSRDTLDKISEALAGRTLPEHVKKKMSTRKKQLMTDEKRKRISEGRKAIMTEEYKASMNKNKIRVPCSDETKEKIRKANIGKTLKEETKKKMSEVRQNMEYSDEYREQKRNLISGTSNPKFKGGYYIGDQFYAMYGDVKEAMKGIISKYELRKRFNSPEWPDYIIVDNRKEGN